MTLHSAAMMMGHSYPPLTVGVSPANLNTSDTSSTVTSGQAMVTPAGGSGLWTYAWIYVSGDSPIQPVSPGSAVTTFRASLGAGSSVNATWKCVVTDTVTQQVVNSPNLVISLYRGYPPLSVSVGTAHAALSSQTPANITPGATANVSGGAPPYNYSWSNDSGFNTIPSGNTCYFGVSAVPPATTRTGTGSLTVTDSNGQPGSASFSIIAENTATAPPPLSASASPDTVVGYSNDGYVVTDTTTITPSGGVAPYSYSWARTGGDGAASGGQSCSFTYSNAINGSYGGTFQCTVTDARGYPYAVTVSAGFNIFIFSGPQN